MIKPGMTIAEAIMQLTRGFMKAMGRQPDGLEKIKINQEARQKVKDLNKVVDMQGNVLDPSKPIMGGKQLTDSPLNDLKSIVDDFKPMKKNEGIMKVKPDTDDGISVTIDGKTQNMSPEGIIDVLNKKALMTKQKKGTPATEAFEKEFNTKLYGDETFEELMEIKNTGKHPRGEPKAEGGRIGYKDGPDQPGRRKFMKIIGGLATIPIVGKYFKQADKVAPAAEKAAEVMTQAPSYFFDMITKIKMFGKTKPSAAYGPRQEVHVYSAKNGDEYELVEDLATGDQIITKDKMGVGVSGDKTFDTITDRTVFQNKKGIGDEATKGTPPDEYEEMKVLFDNDGTMGDVDNIDEIVRKEIIKEASEVTPPIKKAGGGLAYMLGE